MRIVLYNAYRSQLCFTKAIHTNCVCAQDNHLKIHFTQTILDKTSETHR